MRLADAPAVSHSVMAERYASPDSCPHRAGNYRRPLAFEGRERFYDVHVHPGYNPASATPLVLNFHGGMGNPEQQRRDSQMDRFADEEGFIAAYPAGSGQADDRFLFWNSGIGSNYANQHNINDVGFTACLLDDIATCFRIDPRRVYATGMSNGGFLSCRLAIEMSDRIAAIAPVAGGIGVRLERRAPTRPVSVMLFHGTKDRIVPYHGGPGQATLADTNILSVEETVAFWCRAAGLPDEPVETLRNGAATCLRYGTDTGEPEVCLWTLEGAGHTWPGGESSIPAFLSGPINHDIHATQVMWDFFRRHPLP